MNEVPVIMPQLGETVAEGTVSRWLVEVGGSVKAHEPLLEVSTDKVDTEIASPVDGVLASVAVNEDETVPVGTVLATINTQAVSPERVPDSDRTEIGSVNATPVASTTDTATAVTPALAHDIASESGTPGRAGGKWRHDGSPRVRRLARELGVDLATVSSTGPGGRTTIQDVTAARPQTPTAPERPRAGNGAAAPPPVAAATPAAATAAPVAAPPPKAAAPPIAVAATSVAGGRVEKLSRRRKVIAERMTRSLANTAQLTTVVEVDLTLVQRARKAARHEFERRFHTSLTMLAFVAEAAVHALGLHPILNARLDLDAGTVTYPPNINLGIAVDTPEGLIVPVLPGAEDLSVIGLARRISDVASRSRNGTIRADELSGGTFTITNTGSRGALFDTPILNAPESAILGLGAAVRRPVIIDAGDEERLAVRLIAYLALTYDHRLIDGADAARYLSVVTKRLEQPDNGNPKFPL